VLGELVAGLSYNAFVGQFGKLPQGLQSRFVKDDTPELLRPDEDEVQELLRLTSFPGSVQ
jgi:hypothetical protein